MGGSIGTDRSGDEKIPRGRRFIPWDVVVILISLVGVVVIAIVDNW
jgi:hypothetical protein